MMQTSATPVETAPLALLPPPAANLPGLRKAAVLVMTLGESMAKELLRGLSEREIQLLTEEISNLQNVPPEQQAAVLGEFYGLQETQQFMLHGGPMYASKLLIEAFGRQRADEFMRDIAAMHEQSQGDLLALQKMDPAQLSKFLDGEHPQTVALVLAHLNPRRGSAVLMHLREEMRTDVIRRLAEMRQFSPEMAQKVALVLFKRMHTLGSNGRQQYAGFKAVADLLNRLDTTASRSILERIEASEPKVALGIRNLMFTFEDLLTVPAQSIRELMGLVDKKTLAVALKNADEDLRAHLFRALSSRAIEMLLEDMEVLGAVRTREINAAQQEILALARQLESEGKITLRMESEEEELG